ncbi:MAG TPA: peptide chain release factor N(5)-glutamine methyltransferase [Gammaproteobacteria bacterium]|nr:peptide chain release factor N(5)-glutamine methyltransferase [Gammaproteobacteria bacterium]
MSATAVAAGRTNTPTLRAALEFAQSRLAAALPSAFDSRAEQYREALALLRFAAGLSEAQILANGAGTLEAGAWAQYRDIVERRAAGEPFAYIECRRGFHALDLHVDPSVLIPRPETEIIVDTVLARSPENAFSVIDLGTGSGAVALGIAHARPEARVTAVDISAAALAVARGNAAALGATIEFVESDWFAAPALRQYDFICCNPPYVRSDDPHLHDLRFEPRLALDGGRDGLREIRRVLAAAPGHLNAGGSVVIEHGYDQADAVVRIAEAARLQHLETIRDLGGRERVSVFCIRETG